VQTCALPICPILGDSSFRWQKIVFHCHQSKPPTVSQGLCLHYLKPAPVPGRYWYGRSGRSPVPQAKSEVLLSSAEGSGNPRRMYRRQPTDDLFERLKLFPLLPPFRSPFLQETPIGPTGKSLVLLLPD